LDAVGTEREREASRRYVYELEVAVTDIDIVINVFESDMAKEKFGEELANKIHSHAIEIKAKGVKFRVHCKTCESPCDLCDSCLD